MKLQSKILVNTCQRCGNLKTEVFNLDKGTKIFKIIKEKKILCKC